MDPKIIFKYLSYYNFYISTSKTLGEFGLEGYWNKKNHIVSSLRNKYLIIANEVVKNNFNIGIYSEDDIIVDYYKLLLICEILLQYDNTSNFDENGFYYIKDNVRKYLSIEQIKNYIKKSYIDKPNNINKIQEVFKKIIKDNSADQLNEEIKQMQDEINEYLLRVQRIVHRNNYKRDRFIRRSFYAVLVILVYLAIYLYRPNIIWNVLIIGMIGGISIIINLIINHNTNFKRMIIKLDSMRKNREMIDEFLLNDELKGMLEDDEITEKQKQIIIQKYFPNF